MEVSHGGPTPRRAPFTDIQNTHASLHTDSVTAKPAEKAPLSNKLRAIQIGQKTLAAFKERKAEAKARRTAAKAATADPGDPACPPLPSSPAAATACSGAASQSSTRVTAQRHAQTPSRIPPATNAPARSGAGLSAPTPTKIPNGPRAEGPKESTPTAAKFLQAQSVPVSPRRGATASARPYSAMPTPRVSPQAACIEGGVLGGQRNPLFDDAMPRPASPEAALATATSAGQLPAAGEAACVGGISNSSCSSNGLAGPRPLSVEVDYNAGSGPHSAHSMASGLSRSGSFAPSTLSVLYENQAMKVEREELKSELKLISARLAVLEARSKGWGRIGQAPKGRSQSAPRGVPRSRIAPAARPASITEQHAEPERAGRAQQRAARPESLAHLTESAAKVPRETVSRPSSPRKGNGASFGSRASSPARQRRAIVFGSRAPSTGPQGHSQTTRSMAPKPDVANSGPPAPPAGTMPAACPSSVERWAGPGGRLGRTRLMRQTPGKASRQKTCEDKENSAMDMADPKEQVSKLALTAAKLGLQHAFRPRLA
ncbi:g7114 [Coccomyxa viridis]|uniref:G7114 protein n=1 Tax=Coccomyxa viridis TaxID=1274662 RepID=A0ABP1G115_9CHLO